jgi:hypothetical protein
MRTSWLCDSAGNAHAGWRKVIGKTRVTRTSIWVGLLLLLIACSSLTDDQRPVAFIEIRFQDLEPSFAQSILDDELAEEQGASLYLEAVYALDKSTVFLYGKIGATYGRSALLRSGDGGHTWREVMRPILGNSVLSFTFAEDGFGWVIAGWTVEGPGPLSLHRTADYGQTWEWLSNIHSVFGVPYGMAFFDEQKGHIKIAYFSANPYSDRLAVLTTTDGGGTWVETNSFSIWEEWDGITTPTLAIDVTNRDGVRNRLLDLAGWDNPEDGCRYLEPCEAIGRDGSRWQLHRFDEDYVISRRLATEAEWNTTIEIPRHYGYLGGRILPPER